MPIGVLPIDSIYTPIDRVNLTVQDTRVGQVTDYDKLTLDVWTKGTMAPDEAVSLAAKVLSEHLKLFIDLSEVAQQTAGREMLFMRFYLDAQAEQLAQEAQSGCSSAQMRSADGVHWSA